MLEIPSGAQIFDSYGEKSNEEFFADYGFINLNKDGENLADTYFIYDDLNKKDPHFKVKKDVFLEGDTLL